MMISICQVRKVKLFKISFFFLKTIPDPVYVTLKPCIPILFSKVLIELIHNTLPVVLNLRSVGVFIQYTFLVVEGNPLLPF